jgi:hypothetical protein
MSHASPTKAAVLTLPTRVASSALRRRAVLRGGSPIGFQASRLGALLRAVDLPPIAAAAGDHLRSATTTGEEARRLLRGRRHRSTQVWKRTATRGIMRASRTDSGAPLRLSNFGGASPFLRRQDSTPAGRTRRVPQYPDAVPKGRRQGLGSPTGVHSVRGQRRTKRAGYDSHLAQAGYVGGGVPMRVRPAERRGSGSALTPSRTRARAGL